MKALWWVLRKPVLLNRVLTDPDSWKEYVQDHFPFPEGLPVIRMDQLFDGREFSIGPMTFLDGGSLPTDMMLLAGLAERKTDCSYFEIGTWRGESVAVVSTRANACYTLCLSDEEMRSMGMHEKSIASHRLFSHELDNVVQLRGNSKTYDFASIGQKFDLIFIDGDHHYDAILSDTKQVFKHLVHPGSVVVWHDYGYHPDTIRYEVMAAILDGAGPERQDRIYHVAHTKAAIFTGNTHAAAAASFPVIPDEYYHLELSRHQR